MAEGGIDNITVIVADVVEAGGTESAVVLGAAEERTIPAPQTRMREPADDEVEDTLITERPLVTVDDEARYTPLAPNKRRFIRPLVILLVVLLIAAAGLGSAYAWTRTQYFVGVSGDQVAIYQGLSDGVGSGFPGVRGATARGRGSAAVLPRSGSRQHRRPGPADRPRDHRRIDGGRQALREQKPPKESPTPTPTSKPTSTRTPSPDADPTSTSVGPGELDC